MNCLNCGAPLEVVDGREHFRCPYCDSLLFPDDLQNSIDRIKSLGRPSDLECTVCSRPMTQAAMDGRKVSFCESCRGVLISSDDFLQVVGLRREKRQGPPDEPRPLNPEDLRRQIHCPSCRRSMEVHPYYGGGSVVIDSCRNCHSIWLDYGEMAVIERAPGRR